MSRTKRALVRNERVNKLNCQDFEAFHIANKDVHLAKNEKEEKISFCEFLRRIWLVLRNKADTQGHMTVGAFSMVVSVTFRAVALLGFTIFVIGIVGTIIYGLNLSWESWPVIIGNVYVLAMAVMIIFIIGMCSLVMWGASNEMRKEDDKNYILSVFSGLVSFAALVVALVALVKE